MIDTLLKVMSKEEKIKCLEKVNNKLNFLVGDLDMKSKVKYYDLKQLRNKLEKDLE